MKNNPNEKKDSGGRPTECNIEEIIGRADFEIERLKKNRDVSHKSRYKKYAYLDKGNYSNLNKESKCGLEFNLYEDPTYLGPILEWRKAFEMFAKKKVNIYGKKVDRLALLNEDFKFGNGGGGTNGDKSVFADEDSIFEKKQDNKKWQD
jgi:hypothetical protein